MADSASWRLDRQTRQLESVTGQAGGLWRDDASKFIHERYLRPHQGQSADMSGRLKEIERALDDIKGFLREHQAEVQKAHENAQQVATEVEAAEQLISSASDSITRTLDHVSRSQQFDQIAHSLVTHAGSCCDGCASESGEFRPAGAPTIFKIAAATPATSIGRGNSGLSPEQEATLRRYTGDGFYEELNAATRSKPITEVQKLAPEIVNLMRGLQNLPTKTGIMHRGVSDLSSEALSRYRPGQDVVENFFTSASTDSAKRLNKDGNVYFRIMSKSAHSVAGFDQYDETEVIFNVFSKFHVLATSSHNGKYIIDMIQL